MFSKDVTVKHFKGEDGNTWTKIMNNHVIVEWVRSEITKDEAVERLTKLLEKHG